MALINCPNCGHMVSDLAPKCPECGTNLSFNLTKKKKFCKYCGTEMSFDAFVCPSCGKPVSNNSLRRSEDTKGTASIMSPMPAQNIYIQQTEHKSNGIAIAGFVLSIIGLLVCWIPVLDIITWFLGLLFSFIGVFKAPRGFAVAGLIISSIWVVIVILIFGSIVGLFGMLLGFSQMK